VLTILPVTSERADCVDDAREGGPMVGVVLLKILPVLLYCTLFMSWSSIR
jgi:hypothetical protein